MRVLVLGVNGLLGSAVFQELTKKGQYEVFGLMRNSSFLQYFTIFQRQRLIIDDDVLNKTALLTVMKKVKPDVVINCIGLIKQKYLEENPLTFMPINAEFPHQLSVLCDGEKVRLIHISTDCVFSGYKGMYTESDQPDATDYYGKSKRMGEITHKRNVVTLRTSIVGNELNSSYSLLNWFLAQEKIVQGYRRSIFSGLTANELGRVINNIILPLPELNGLYHVSGEPISKYEFLCLVKTEYKKDISIIPEDFPVINRSLDSTLFFRATRYRAPSWEKMLRDMYQSNK